MAKGIIKIQLCSHLVRLRLEEGEAARSSPTWCGFFCYSQDLKKSSVSWRGCLPGARDPLLPSPPSTAQS
jgi:hypothetical protein